MRLRAAAAVASCTAIFVLLLLASGALGWAEQRSYDFRMYLQARQTVDPHIVIVGITNGALAKEGRWPWPRSLEAQLIDRLSAAGARVIAFDVLFTEPSRNPGQDALLAAAARRAGNVVFASYGTFPPDVHGTGYIHAVGLSDPVPPLAAAAAAIGAANALPDPDGTLRWALSGFTAGGRPVPSLDLAAADLYLGRKLRPWNGTARTLSIGRATVPLDRVGRFLIDFRGGLASYRMVPYQDVLDGSVSPAVFRGRIVLVGAWAPGMGDFWPSPVGGGPWPGVAFHAEAISTLLDGGLAPPQPATTGALIVAGAAVGALLAAVLPVGWAAVLLALLATVYFLFTTVLMATAGPVLDVVHPLVAAGGSYGAMLVWRLTTEQRARARVTGMFARHVGPEVVQALVASGEAALKPGGVRRQVTVLFADMRGFTPLAERLGSEAVVDILNRSFDAITSAVHRHRGTLDKFVGDGVMALWNAPLEVPDHAVAAVQAARDIQSDLGPVRAEIEARYGVRIGFGIGVHTGEAIVGNLGSRTRLEYTAVGDTVNLAARLEANAASGQVLVSEQTYEAVDGRVALQRHATLTVKGRAEPVVTYVVGAPAP